MSGLALARQGQLNDAHPDRRPRRTTTPLAAIGVSIAAACLFTGIFFVAGLVVLN